MSELYQKNLEIIQGRWPEVAARIDDQEVKDLDAKLVEGKCQTISINNIQLSSRYDAMEEALFYRSQTEGSEYSLLGCAMGNIPQLLVHDNQAQKMTIYLINPDVTKLVLHFTDQTSWLSDSRFEMAFLPEHPMSVDIILAGKGTIVLPAEKVLCKRHNPNLFYQLESAIFYSHANKTLLGEEDKKYNKLRLKNNLPLLKKRKPVDNLNKKHHKKYSSVILIGAGPTLEDQVERLQELMFRPNRPFIIAVSMAGRMLYKHGIYPDVIINVDRGKEIKSKGGLAKFIPFELADKGTKLVVSTLTPTNVIKQWAGKLYYCNLNTDDYTECQNRLPTERLFMYGSVIAPALHMAASYARERVYFMGMDFSFPGKKLHAGMDNSTHSDYMNINEMVLNGNDELVETSTSYRTFLTGVECLTHEFKNIEFINCSRKGAKIQKTTYLDGGEII